MNFRFSMERVLKYRRHLLDQAQMELAAARQKEQQIKRRLEGLKSELRDGNEQWEQAQREGMDVATHISYKDYINSLEKRLPPLKREQQKAIQAVADRQQRVLEKEKDVKVLEKLKEKHQEAYALELARWEQKQLDEVVILKSYQGDDNA